MKKVFYDCNEREVHFGDKVEFKGVYFILSEDNVQELLKEKWIFKVPMSIEYYMVKTNMPFAISVYFAKCMPVEYTWILLMEIARKLDQQYEDHIEDSNEIYTISRFSGNIIKVDKDNIVNYKSFPAFRSKSDAGIAYKIMREPLNILFDKHKDKVEKDA